VYNVQLKIINNRATTRQSGNVWQMEAIARKTDVSLPEFKRDVVVLSDFNEIPLRSGS
jgi:hypothetical protein